MSPLQTQPGVTLNVLLMTTTTGSSCPPAKEENLKGKGTSQGIQKNGLLEEMEVEKSRWKELSE